MYEFHREREIGKRSSQPVWSRFLLTASYSLPSYFLSLSLLFLINNPLRVLFAPAGCWAPCFHPYIEKKKNAVSWLYTHTLRENRACISCLNHYLSIHRTQARLSGSCVILFGCKFLASREEVKKKKKRETDAVSSRGPPTKTDRRIDRRFPPKKKKRKEKAFLDDGRHMCALHAARPLSSTECWLRRMFLLSSFFFLLLLFLVFVLGKKRVFLRVVLSAIQSWFLSRAMCGWLVGNSSLSPSSLIGVWWL